MHATGVICIRDLVRCDNTAEQFDDGHCDMTGVLKVVERIVPVHSSND
jgi:hypothetical protein